MMNLFVFEPATLSTILLFIAILLLITTKLTFSKKNYNLPPSPPRIPLIGNLHQLSSLLHRSLASLAKKYGPLMLVYLGQVPTLVVSSAELAKEVLKTHDQVFSGRPSVMAARVLLYNCRDIFFDYGELWRNLRKLCALHLLSTKKVQAFQHQREEEVGCMMAKISEICKWENGLVDMTELLHSFSFGILYRAVTGEGYKGRQGDEQYEKLEKLTKDISVVFPAFRFQDYFSWLACLDVLFGFDRRTRIHSQEWDAVLDHLINDHVDRVKDNGREGFVDVLLSVNKDPSMGFTLSKDEMKALLVDIFAAGTDTSYITLEWAMAELIRNPHILRKLQEEIQSIVGEKQMVRDENLPNMVFLKAVIKEVLRLRSPVPLLIPHETINDCKVLHYWIPKKTRVLINAWAIGRDPKTWEEPEEFKPERFIDSTVDYTGNHFQFIPFGAGRRMCPGMHFAAFSVELALANLIHQFDWELPSGLKREDFDMAESSGLSVKRKQKLYLVAKPSCSSEK